MMKFKDNLARLLLPLCAVLVVFLLAGCIKELKEGKPIIPIKEYEKMLLGKLSSDYVGNENCLKNCHDHDQLALDFKASTMGDQLAKSSSGLLIVDCESCHGPASEMMDAMKGLDPVKDTELIIKAHVDNLIDHKALPAGAVSLICLKCHTANATFNIHNWNASVHAANDVSCSNCHQLHAGPDLIPEPREVAKLCTGCHMDVAAQFNLPSHHPLKEGKIYCVDCHDPHGTANPHNLREMTVKETCARCHTEKAGPFLYEHSDNTEECTTCHQPHGTMNRSMLKLPVVFLCKQCHPQHRNVADELNPDGSVALGGRSMTYTRCTDCHSMIHGSDRPGVGTGGGAMTR